MAADLSHAEAARELGVHRVTLTRWADQGKVRYWISPGGRRRYRAEDLEALRETTTRPAGNGKRVVA